MPQITIWEIEYEEVEQIKVLNQTNATVATNVEGPASAAPQAGEQEKTIIKKAVSYTEIKHL